MQVFSGAVFHVDNLRLSDGSRKGKFVVVGPTSPLILYTINTKLTEWVKSHQHVIECHTKLSVADYDFLSHTSFLNCYDFYRHEEISRQRLVAWIKSGKAGYRARLHDKDLKRMRASIAKSRVIEHAHKNHTLDALDKCLE